MGRGLSPGIEAPFLVLHPNVDDSMGTIIEGAESLLPTFERIPVRCHAAPVHPCPSMNDLFAHWPRICACTSA